MSFSEVQQYLPDCLSRRKQRLQMFEQDDKVNVRCYAHNYPVQSKKPRCSFDVVAVSPA